MALSGGAELLRGRESPARATFLELFLDLVYVFALTRVSQRLVQDFVHPDDTAFTPALHALVLLLALWLLWTMTTLTTSRFDPERPAIQVIVVVTMFASMVMAVAVPQAFEQHGPAFALAYLAAQLGRPLYLGLALRGDPRQRISVRLIFWWLGTAPLWIVGAFASEHGRTVLWCLALFGDYLGHALRWPTPKLGRSASAEWALDGAHTAERYQQFFLIALGESILISGFTFSGGSFTPATVAAFSFAFLTTVLLWRIYFFHAGFALAEAFSTAHDQGRFTWSATYTHLSIVAGVVVTAVGYELVIGQPHGETAPSWIVVTVGGPLLFLAGRLRFGYEVFGQILWSRLVGMALLVLVAVPMVLLPPLAVAGTVTAILLGIAIHDVLRIRGRRAATSPL